MDLQALLDNRAEAAAIILFGIGLTTLLLHRNLLKKVIGFSFMDSAIFLFLASEGYISGRAAPIRSAASDLPASAFINPLPAGLVLTGIVVSVSVTALMLSLTVRLYERFHTLDLDRIVRLAREDAAASVGAAAPVGDVERKAGGNASLPDPERRDR